jgi:cytochrome c
MKKLTFITLFSLAGITAWASPDLANKNSCLACHAIDSKIVGPAFQEISRKYSYLPEAENYLAISIKVGGGGKWGQMPMPPQVQLSDADAKSLATWILSLAK